MRRRALARYVLYQVPGWTVAAVLLWYARGWLGLSDGLAFGAWLAWIAKDAVIWPFVREAFEHRGEDADHHARALRGATAVAKEAIAPRGLVRVGAELWRAELAGGARAIAAGEPVRVRAVRGLVLEVEAAEGDAPDQDADATR